MSTVTPVEILDWSRGAQAARAACVPALVEAHADATPDAPALICAGERLTYRDLDRAASRLARVLAKHGAGRDRLVAVCLPRGTFQVQVLLAVLKAGSAYLPLSPDDPPARLRELIAQARPVLLVAGADVGVVPALRADELAELGASEPEDRPGTDITPGQLAYVTYTSGSTGRPKGVMITHRGVANLADPRQPMAPGPADVVVYHTPLQFDASTYELWCTLTSGACVLVAPPGQLTMADYGTLAGQASVLCLTSSLFHLLADEGCQELARLRLLNVGGETVDPDHVDLVSGPVRIMHCYGPTEGTMLGTTGPAARRTAGGRVPIGQPLTGCQTYVLDEDLRPLPTGAAGELYLGGAGLARGYLGQAGLTAQRFVPSPFGGAPGERLYRTGDLVRWLDTGELEFLGRADDQVKLRGYRIEPAEVESALRAHSAVRAAVVVVRPGTDGVRRLAGYVVLGSDTAALPEIRAWLAARLPSYLVPADLVVLESLPLTPWGKLDRQALPAPATTETPAGDAAGTATELRITRAWSAALGQCHVGPDDHFMDLGGDSLRAMRVIAELADLGYHLTLAELFRLGTVRKLAFHLDRTAQS